MRHEENQHRIQTFLDDVEAKRRYESALAEIQPDLEKIEAELDDCHRLTEDDFVIRINTRD